MNNASIKIDKDIIKVATKKGSSIKELSLPTADVFRFVTDFIETSKEIAKTKRDIAKVEAQERLLAQEITQKYDFYYYVFDKIFAERRAGILKSFQIIDKGMSENNASIITEGLRSLSQIVSSSPFTNIDSLRNALESGKGLEV